MRDDERQAFSRLLERTFGRGFRLVVVELRTPTEGDELVSWLRGRVGPDVREIEARGEFSTNPLATLDALGTGERTLLVIRGLEQSEREVGPDEGALRALNVQRDLLVARHPCFWVVVVHPSLVNQARTIAADFMDFSSLWVGSEEVEEVSLPAEILASPFGTIEVPPVQWQGTATERALLDGAWEAAARGEGQRALDLVARVRLADTHLPPQLELVEAYVLLVSGDGEQAAGGFSDLATRLPTAIADVAVIGAATALMRVGRYEEALALVEPIQPADPRWNLQRTFVHASAFQALGLYPAALRVLRDEVIPGCRALGGAETEAVAWGMVAGIYAMSGDAARALATLGERILPLLRSDTTSSKFAIGLHAANLLVKYGRAEEGLALLDEHVRPWIGRFGAQGRMAYLQMEGVAYLRSGDLDRAYAAFESFRREAALAGQDDGSSDGLFAEVLIKQSRLDEAIDLLRNAALPKLRRRGHAASVQQAEHLLARALVQRGQYDEAIALWRGHLFTTGSAVRVPAHPAVLDLADALFQRNRGADRRRSRILLDEAIAASEPQAAGPLLVARRRLFGV